MGRGPWGPCCLRKANPGEWGVKWAPGPFPYEEGAGSLRPRPVCPEQVLIGDEPEAGMENLLEVKIPTEMEQQLQHLDQEEEEEEEVLLERIA